MLDFGVSVVTESAYEASLVDGIEVYAPDSLQDVVAFFRGQKELPKIEPSKDAFVQENSAIFDVDFAAMSGKERNAHLCDVLRASLVGVRESLMAKGAPVCEDTLSAIEYLKSKTHL